MTKRNKITLIICSAIVGIPALLGAGILIYSIVERNALKKDTAIREEQAKAAAVKWVEEKYGFTPEITDVKLKQDGALFEADYTGIAEVWAYDGKDNFRVLVGENDEHTGDEYQKQEIEDALLAEVNSILPGGRVLRYEFVNNGNDGTFYHSKFTGDNLREMLSETMQNHLKLGYVNTDFANAPDFPILRELQIFTELFSFEDEAYLDDAARTEVYFDGEQWAPMLTGGCCVRPDGNEPFSYDVMDCGDFKIMYRYDQTGEPPIIRTENNDTVIRHFREQYPNSFVFSGTAHGWKICTDSLAFYLYYPVHGEIPLMRCIEAVDEEETADENTYIRHNSMYAHGGYYVLNCNASPIHHIAIIDGFDD